MSAETYEQPTMTCPRCGAEYEDFDGFGVVYCEACGFCRHVSRSGAGPGRWVCDCCGDVEVELQSVEGLTKKEVSYDLPKEESRAKWDEQRPLHAGKAMETGKMPMGTMAHTRTRG